MSKRNNKLSSRAPLYQPVGPALLRAPLLPADAYRERLGSAAEPFVAGDPQVRLALLVGSRSVFEAWERTAQSGQIEPRLGGKLLRYLIRMSTRPTPYGLFAGVALARFGPSTNLTLGPRPRRCSRPEIAWVLAVAASLESRPEIRRRLRFVANPAARIGAGRVALHERVPRQADEPPAGISVRATAPVRQALFLAREPIPYDVLRDRLAEATASEPAKVEMLLTNLWEQTLLLTDLMPSFTSLDPARGLAERLSSIGEAHTEHATLSTLLNDFASWDELAPDLALSTFRGIADRANALVENGVKTPIQVDMELELQGHELNRTIAHEAAVAAELMLRLSPVSEGPTSVIAFRQAFLSRYNEGREVPLLELLDPDVGLRYPSSPPPTHARGLQSIRDRTLLHLACRAVRTRERVLDLSDRHLTDLETWTPNALAAPLSLDINVLVGSRSAAELDAGDFQLVVGPNIGAASAGRNLGRFAYLFGNQGIDVQRGIAHAEDRLTPGILAAELHYRPRRFRAANVTVRPNIRSHEICLDGCPPCEGVTGVPIDELVVGVRDARFYLRWLRNGQEVRITNSHMLNPAKATDIVRFLSEVGEDGRVQLEGFSWGPAEGFPFLPRVQRERIVLRPAEWRIGPRDFSLDSLSRFRDELAHWIAVWDVPRHVFLTQDDNRLLFDLRDAAQTEELFHEVRHLKGNGSVQLQEVIPPLDQVWLEGPGGRFYAEFAVPLVLARPSPAPPPSPGANRNVRHSPPNAVPQATRSNAAAFVKPPGSDWLFLKIYSGLRFHDDLIAGPLRDFAGFVRTERMAQRWFFLRYTDPHPHIRVRFGGEPSVLTGRLFPVVCDWASQLLADGYCNRFTFDTYDREVERYGGERGLAIAESIFCADSDAVANYTNLVAHGAAALDKENLAVITLDNLLDALGLSEVGRLKWLRSIAPGVPKSARNIASDRFSCEHR